MERNLYIFGDYHNIWDAFKAEIIMKNIRNADIIHVGDGGFGMHTRKPTLERLGKQNDFLRDRGIIWYNIRGNHDNPNWFLSKNALVKFLKTEDDNTPHFMRQDYHYLMNHVPPKKYADTVRGYTNIKFIPDYTVLNLRGYNILCIGGAITVDRLMRVKGRDYFPNEPLAYLPNKLQKLKDINIVVTHTKPAFVPPTRIKGGVVDNFKKIDNKLMGDLEEERQIMSIIYGDIVNHNKIDKWFYGHFHRGNKFTHKAYNDIEFRCIEPNKGYCLI